MNCGTCYSGSRWRCPGFHLPESVGHGSCRVPRLECSAGQGKEACQGSWGKRDMVRGSRLTLKTQQSHPFSSCHATKHDSAHARPRCAGGDA